jgi:predicted nucleic acid-binding protein
VLEAWDTTTAARLRPGSAVLDYARERRGLGDPVAFTATTLNEISYGLRKATLSGRPAAQAQLRWLRDQIDAGLIDVLAFDDRAAHIAGALRARMPTPPSPSKRPRGRSKAENRVAWVLDLQTAATVFAHGYNLVTADAHHSVIAAQLDAITASASALRIHTPPRL